MLPSDELPRNSPNNQHVTVPADRVDSAHMDVMRVSLAHYKNSTRILQDQLRAANKKLDTVEHTIHELGIANKISKDDMEKLLVRNLDREKYSFFLLGNRYPILAMPSVPHQRSKLTEVRIGAVNL